MQKDIYKLIMWVGLILLLVFVAKSFNAMTTKVKKVSFNIERITRDMEQAQDSIKTLNAITDSLKHKVSVYSDSLDSISKVKSKVIIKYRDQKNFVSDASLIQLDSIIRANTSIGK